MIRKTIFWAHLVAGVAAGLVIFMMSLTGVLITYEYQMVENANKNAYASAQVGEEALPLDQIMGAASLELGRDITGVVVWNDPAAPVQAAYDRRGGAYMDPYTGEFLGTGVQDVQNFLAPLRNWHRQLGFTGESQRVGRAITGASNTLFIFILISGIYLWLPKIWNGATLRMRLWFQKNPANSKVRDYNWHHVFGFWALIPLIAIAVTATAISYPSVKSTINQMAGGPGQPSRPERGQEQAPRAQVSPVAAFEAATDVPTQLSLDELVEIAKEIDDDWYKITAAPARDVNSQAEIRVAYDFSMAPTQEKTFSLDPYTGEVVREFGWDQMTKAQQVDQVFRRLHTGEFYGIVGQTIAGIASLLACIMVWTGLALAWRRLISPLFKKRKSVAT